MRRFFKKIKSTWIMFLVNKIYAGTHPKTFKVKRKLLISLGHKIGNNTKIVGPIFCTGKLVIGSNCWIGRNFSVLGNGTVTIGDNCDIAPDVTFSTGGHKVGSAERRAGDGEIYCQTVGNGCWIGCKSLIINNTNIGKGCVIAAGACVVKNVEDNVLVGGVPARIIKKLS